MKIWYTLAALLLIGCSNEKELKALNDFDHSLDSKMQSAGLTKLPYMLFNGDTLRANPRRIEEVSYLEVYEKDTMVVPGSRRIYDFKDGYHISTFYPETSNATTIHYLNYQDDLDNAELAKLQKKVSPVQRYIGRLVRYNKDGNVIKDIWVFEDGKRKLEVFTYDERKRLKTQWRRSYDKELMNIDSLKNTPIERVEYSYREGLSEAGTRYFKGDTLMNESAPHNPEVYSWTEIDPKTGKRVRAHLPDSKPVFKYDEKGNWISKDKLGLTTRRITY